MKGYRMTEAIEITTFKLAKGVTVEEFVADNADINEWLNLQPGFQSRRIAELDGAIVDVLIWDSAVYAREAADRMMEETAHSPVHKAINQRSVSWRVAEVRQHIRSTAGGGLKTKDAVPA